MVEDWRRVWRAAAPLLPRRGLEALRAALEEDDPALLQDATTAPALEIPGWPCEGACLLAYPLWQGQDEPAGHSAVEVEELFAALCLDIDVAMHEPGAVRWLTRFWDEMPRDEARKLILPEVILALQAEETQS